jgi:hypothetical protein
MTPPVKHYLVSMCLHHAFLSQQLTDACSTLSQWTEQPENVPTALAIIPNRSKGAEGKHVSKALKKGNCEFW